MQLLERDAQLVALFWREFPETTPTLQRFAVEFFQNPGGKSTSRACQQIQNVGSRIAAPRLLFDPLAERSLELRHARIGDCGMCFAVRLPTLFFGRLAQGIEAVDRRAGLRDHQQGFRDEYVPVSRIIEFGHQPFGVFSECLQLRRHKRARPAFEVQIVQHDERRVYDASAGSILDVIHEVDSGIHKLLLVGHNPSLHDLILKLIETARESDLARLQQKLPTAGLVVIDFDIDLWSQASMGRGHLERFETPKSVADG